MFWLQQVLMSNHSSTLFFNFTYMSVSESQKPYNDVIIFISKHALIDPINLQTLN